MDMKSKDIFNLFYLKFKSKSKFKFSNITSKYLSMNHFNTIFMENDDAEKSLMSHIAFAHPKQYLHNKKKRPNREHQGDAGQIPSEDQVRTSSQL